MTDSGESNERIPDLSNKIPGDFRVLKHLYDYDERSPSPQPLSGALSSGGGGKFRPSAYKWVTRRHLTEVLTAFIGFYDC